LANVGVTRVRGRTAYARACVLSAQCPVNILLDDYNVTKLKCGFMLSYQLHLYWWVYC